MCIIVFDVLLLSPSTFHQVMHNILIVFFIAQIPRLAQLDLREVNGQANL